MIFLSFTPNLPDVGWRTALFDGRPLSGPGWRTEWGPGEHKEAGLVGGDATVVLDRGPKQDRGRKYYLLVIKAGEEAVGCVSKLR